MASIEAVEALKADAATWARWCAERPGERIDLSSAQLADCDLAGRAFARCDLSGARLQGANLDDAVFERCTFDGTNLTNASLIGCKFTAGTVITGTTLDHVVMRGTEFSGTRLTGVTAVGCGIKDVRLTGCTLEDLTLERCNLTETFLAKSTLRRCQVTSGTLRGCEFTRGCHLENLTFTGVTVAGCEFSDALITGWRLAGGVLESTSIVNSRIRGFSAPQADVSGLDLSGTTIAGGSAADWGLADAVLMRTAFVGCDWPEKFIALRWWGSFSPHPALMAQPVQDVNGLPPVIRRDIADVQYLVAKRRAASRPTRVLYALWGLTSAYGQNMTRLTIFSVALVIAHALGILAAQDRLLGMHAPQLPVFMTAFDSAGSAFLGLGGRPPSGASALVSGLYLSARFFGFLVVGIWVGIAVNKISKLGQ